MSDELTEEEKAKFVEAAEEYINPIADKYELTDTNGKMALIEAFQAGIKFFYEEQKKRRPQNGGVAQSPNDDSFGERIR